jgi:hypothetical protein
VAPQLTHENHERPSATREDEEDEVENSELEGVGLSAGHDDSLTGVNISSYALFHARTHREKPKPVLGAVGFRYALFAATVVGVVSEHSNRGLRVRVDLAAELAFAELDLGHAGCDGRVGVERLVVCNFVGEHGISLIVGISHLRVVSRANSPGAKP